MSAQENIASRTVLRNLLVAFLFCGVLVVLRAMPGRFYPNSFVLLGVFLAGLFWANHLVAKRGHPVWSVALSVAALVILIGPVWFFSMVFGRIGIDMRYKAQGFQIVEGCNGGAASQADFQVYEFRELLAMATNRSKLDTNLILEINRGLALAQEKAQVLDAECALADHRDLHPWKTNWVVVRPMLEDIRTRVYDSSDP